MKWFKRLSRALYVSGALSAWFEEASADGSLSHEEVFEGIEMLIDVCGYSGKIKVEPFTQED